jgi:hypothetical protein
VVGLDRDKKVYYILYKLIKVMRCFKMRRIYEDWKNWARGNIGVRWIKKLVEVKHGAKIKNWQLSK